MTLTDVLVDFAQLSVLMIVAAWLRRKIYALQRFYIPAALLAGILAILCGPQVLGQVSPIHMEFTTLGQWSGVLSAIVFSCSFLGLKLNKVGAGAMQTYFLGGTIHQLQIVVGLTLTFLLGLFIQDLPLGFGLLPVMGYYGGHSMAIAVGTTFVENGYMESGIELGTTFATVGLLCGVIWGMIIINRAAKSGKTSIKMKIEDLPKDMLTGYYEPGHRPSLGNSVTPGCPVNDGRPDHHGGLSAAHRPDGHQPLLLQSAPVCLLSDLQRCLLHLYAEERQDQRHDRPPHRSTHFRDCAGVPDRLRSGYHKPGRVCHLRRPPDRGLHRSLHRHLLGLLHPGQAGLAQERPV